MAPGDSDGAAATAGAGAGAAGATTAGATAPGAARRTTAGAAERSRRVLAFPLPLVTAGAAPLLPSSKATSVPALTLSPIFTFSSEMTPAAGAGTSSVALSLSRTSSESSFWTVSPALTSSWMTGMSLKSPMFGTFTSVAAKRLSSSRD